MENFRELYRVPWGFVTGIVVSLRRIVALGDSRELYRVPWRFVTGIGVSPRRIVAFGDSTTATRREKGVKRVYSQRLVSLLHTRGICAKVFNAGAGYSHTGRNLDNSAFGKAHALDRLDDEVRGRKPSIVIIQFGINDSWVDGDTPDQPSRIPLKDYVDNLTSIINTLVNDDVRIILMTPNRLGELYPCWLQQRLCEYSEAALKIAKRTGVEVVDIWNIFGEYALDSKNCLDDLLLDGMHPNDSGHRLIAEALVERIVQEKK